MPDHPMIYDIVIAGGGMTGAALAASLANLPLKVALVEPQTLDSLSNNDVRKTPISDEPESVDDFTSRVSALTPASIELLEDIGVWKNISENSVLEYQSMFVWDELGTASISFDAKEVHRNYLGVMVENKYIVSAIYKALIDQENLDLLLGTGVQNLVTELDSDNEQTELILGDGSRIKASLLVIADGPNSKLRGLLGYEMREWDYDHKAIVATIKTSKPHACTAWQRFSENGPLALLPLQDSHRSHRFCSIVWSQKNTVADDLLKLDSEQFCKALNLASEGRLGSIEAVSRRQSFPLKQRHAKHYTKANSVLLGDSAHTIHPLAGQGVNLGFKDVGALRDELVMALNERISPSHHAVLRRYQRKRQGDNLLMMGTMEGFKRLFESENLALRLLRNTGMKWLGGVQSLKKQIIRQAMGGV